MSVAALFAVRRLISQLPINAARLTKIAVPVAAQVAGVMDQR
jgi:hypothetical protein